MRNTKINKEIFKYRETIFFGLTMRQFVSAVIAVGVAVGLYFLCNGVLGKELTSWLCILGAAPFAFIGFFTYNGMTAEEFALAWLKTNILSSGVRVYRAENFLEEIIKTDIEEWSDDKLEKDQEKGKKAGLLSKLTHK